MLVLLQNTVYICFVNFTKERKKSKRKMETRLKKIKEKLNRGDINALALRLGICREWVSKVLNGHGESQKVISAAEELIAERSQTKEQ